jgi:hypothetical protein
MQVLLEILLDAVMSPRNSNLYEVQVLHLLLKDQCMVAVNKKERKRGEKSVRRYCCQLGEGKNAYFDGNAVNRSDQFLSFQELSKQGVEARMLSEFVQSGNVPDINDSVEGNDFPCGGHVLLQSKQFL